MPDVFVVSEDVEKGKPEYVLSTAARTPDIGCSRFPHPTDRILTSWAQSVQGSTPPAVSWSKMPLQASVAGVPQAPRPLA